MTGVTFKNMIMKKYFLLYKILFLSLPAFAQLTISPGAQWVNNGAVTINLNDLDYINNGTFVTGNSVMKFSGTNPNNIGGNSSLAFYHLEIAKTGNKVSLLTDVSINNKVTFTSGLLDLNQKNLVLAASAILNNEKETSRIIGPNGGEVLITVNLNAPNAVNPGNLGAVITSGANLGTITIKRGHVLQNGAGLNTSIQRYFTIISQNNAGLNATLRNYYFDNELNGQNENSLVIYQTTDNGINWSNLSMNSRNTVQNYVEKTGIGNFAKLTLANDTLPSSSVTGLVFNAIRKKPSEVQLTWSTATETKMNGFEVQRKLDNEVDFSAIGFVNSKAPGGNSLSPLSYSYIDPNSYGGTSYYRLKIVDLNNNISYSDIKTVAGKIKGGGGKNNTILQASDTALATTAKAELPAKLTVQKITAGPNPNNGNFWFMVSGMSKETIATLYTIDGKALKQFHVSNLQQRQVNGLKSGVYILKVENLQPFTIIVQADGNTINNYLLNNSPSIKN